jgi:hypothetical protein
MNEQQIKELRGHYHSLAEQKKVLDEKAAANPYLIDQTTFLFVADEIQAVERKFPSLLPAFDRALQGTNRLVYVRMYLGSAIGLLRAQTEAAETSPVTQCRDFRFIADPDLRTILQRDYSEIQRAFVTKCWKSVIILSGGAIEAILLDLLQKNSGKAKSSAKAPKHADLSRWDLKDLICVSVDCSLVSSSVEKLSDPVREFRNLIHPGNELRNKLRFDTEEARIALEVLNIVHRELS